MPSQDKSFASASSVIAKQTNDSDAYDSENDNALEKFNEILSDKGPYENFICFCVLLSGICCSWQTLSYIFLTRDIEFRCTFENITPCDPECPEITYVKKYGSNIIVEWQLVCRDVGKGEVTQSILLLGFMLGCIIFGHIADQNGRRPSFLTACMMMFITGLMTGITPWYWLYCFTRFFLGLACGGLTICCLVFLVEYVDVQKREIMVVMYRLPYAVGYSTLPILAYFLTSWRHLQLTISGFAIVFVAYFWLLPESPRWLVLMGYVDKCAEILEKSATKMHLSDEETLEIIRKAHMELKTGSYAKVGTMADLFKTPNMCKKTCILSFAWFSLYFKFYGLSDYVVFISDRMYLNVSIGAWLTIVGTAAAFPIIKYVTRRRVLFVTFGLSAMCLFSTIAIPENSSSHLISAILSTVVIILASVSFVNMQLFTTELFPTVLRNSGLGFSICIGRLGSVVSPYVLNTHQVKFWFPAVLYASFSAISALIILFLPETKGQKLPDTIEEGENFGKNERRQQNSESMDTV